MSLRRDELSLGVEWSGVEWSVELRFGSHLVEESLGEDDF